MIKFKEYYMLKESIFVPATSTDAEARKKYFKETAAAREKERLAAINVMTNEDGEEVFLTDLMDETFGFDVFDYGSTEYNIEFTRDWILEPYDNDSLSEWVYDNVYEQAQNIFKQHDLSVNDYNDQFEELRHNIEDKVNYNWKRVIPKEVLFIIQDFYNTVEGYDDENPEQTMEDTAKIYEDVKKYGFTMEEVTQLYKESKYGGNISVGIIGNPIDASQEFIQGNIVLIMEFEYYVIGREKYRYEDTTNRLADMIDVNVGKNTYTDDWTWK